MRISDWSSDVCSSDPQSFRSVEKFHHVEPSFADFVARDILLRLAEPRRNGVLAKPLLLASLDELIDHPAVAVIVTPPCHTPSHQHDVQTQGRGCGYTNSMYTSRGIAPLADKVDRLTRDYLNGCRAGLEARAPDGTSLPGYDR